MEYSVALRLNEEDKKRFNAEFLIADFVEQGNFYSIGGRVYDTFTSYDEVLNFLLELKANAINEIDLGYFVGEFLLEYSYYYEQWFVSFSRPDNEIFFEDLKDSLYK